MRDADTLKLCAVTDEQVAEMGGCCWGGDKDRGAGAGNGLLYCNSRSDFPGAGLWAQTAKSGQRECVEGGGSDRAQRTSGRSEGQ